MKNHFKYKCQNLFGHEGGSHKEDVDMISSRCLSVKERNISIGDFAPQQQSSPLRENVALQLGLSPSKNSSRRNQNCATEIPQRKGNGSSQEQESPEEIPTLGMLRGVGRKNIPVRQRHRVHWILIRSLVGLWGLQRRERRYGVSSIHDRDRCPQNCGKPLSETEAVRHCGLVFSQENLQQAVKTPLF